MIRYLQEIKSGKAILWCYLIWYGVVVYFYFDPSVKIWLNSLGISAVIGTALLLSVSNGGAKRDHWQTFRLYLTPFCVSSFSSLIKGQEFFVFISPKIHETLMAMAGCALFLAAIALVKTLAKAKVAR